MPPEAFNPEQKQLRQFSVACIIVCAAWMCMMPAAGRGALVVFLAVGIVVGILGLIRPGWVRLPYLIATVITSPIGVLVSFLILTGLFYLIITPIGFMKRILGDDALRKKPLLSGSGWVQHRMADPVRYWRQF